MLEDILVSFDLAEEDAKKYKIVLTNFMNHFNPQKTAEFNMRKQEEGELSQQNRTPTLFWGHQGIHFYQQK